MTTPLNATTAAPDTSVPTLLPDGPILVATDTSPDADAAFPLAASLADCVDAETVVLSVIPPMTVPVYGVDGMVVSMLPPDDAAETHTAALEAQVKRAALHRRDWRVEVRDGEPAVEISTAASAMKARLLVVGRGRHGPLDRVLNGETILRLLQLGDTPVLAAERTLTSCPRRVVIATDFSPFSLYAAQVAMTVCAPDATIWLVHVGPPFDEAVPYLRERAIVYRAEAATAFAEMRGRLARAKVQFEDVVLTGAASQEVPAFAERNGADLVVSAAHGYGFLRRMMLGSVSAALIRQAPCSVLVVPGSAHATATMRARRSAITRPFDLTTLDTELAAFSTRNDGRRCTVEVDDVEHGVQVLGRDLPLAGISFDRRTATVALMFGTSAVSALHMTHGIPGVTGVDVAGNAGGVDNVLRIAHTGGQTLVSLS